MQGVLAGFATIGIIIGLGFLLAQLRILDTTAQGVLTRTAYYVASPALMVTVLGGTDVHGLLSANLIASLGSVAVSCARTLSRDRSPKASNRALTRRAGPSSSAR